MTAFARVMAALAGLCVLSAGLTMAVSRGKGWPDEIAADAALDLFRPPIRSRPKLVRPPAVAGQFYPADTAELYATVDHLLASSPAIGLRDVRAILVPHAGYQFSGEVAAASFREVDRGFRRVFILSANHNANVNFSGVSIPGATHFAVPGAEIPVSAAADDFRRDPLFTRVDAAHTMHMDEVELPFLHHLRGRPADPDYAIVPMILGQMDANQINRLAEILDRYADRETLFVFSVDLSHYYPDAQARNLDQFTIQSILSRDPDAMGRAVTDGNQVLMTMAALADRRGWAPTFLTYRNSGDASGDRSRVVGYAAFAFHEPFYLMDEERRELTAFARHAILSHLRGEPSSMDTSRIERYPIFRIPRATFVTLKKNGQLRGCIGDLVSLNPVHAGVQKNAVNAAVHDQRFSPVSAAELGQLTLSISVLDFPRRIYVARPDDYATALKPHRDGAILIFQGCQSTYLPQVWRDIPDPVQFLSQLCLKQGSPPDCWRSGSAALYRYSAYEFGEELQP